MSLLSALTDLLRGRGQGEAAADAKAALAGGQGARVGAVASERARMLAPGLTPARLYAILEGADAGNLADQAALFADVIERDPQILADLGLRKQLAAEREWQIRPPEQPSRQEQAATDQAAEVLAGWQIEDLLIDLGDAIGHGWVCLEHAWQRDGATWGLSQPTWRPQTWFQTGGDNAQNVLRLRDGSPAGQGLWPLGWVEHRHKSKSGYIARSGLMRTLVWPSLFENYAVGDLAELLEIYGLPHIIGRYPAQSASPEQRATLLRAVMSLGRNARGIIPEGMAVDYHAMAAAQADPFEAMMRWAQHAKSRCILGGTLTSGTSGDSNTNALGQVHYEQQKSIVRADARQYAGTINRDILAPLATLNFGITDQRRAPRFVLDVSERADLKMLSEAVPVLVSMGLDVPVFWMREKSGIPEPGPGDAVLTAASDQSPAASPQPPVASQTALSGQPPVASQTAAALLSAAAPARFSPGQEDVEGLAEAALADDAATAGPIPAAVLRAAIAAATSPEDLEARLAAVYRDHDRAGFTALVERALFAADVLGYVNAEQGRD